MQAVHLSKLTRSGWRGTLKLPSILFGIATSLLLWIGVFLLIGVERQSNRAAITHDTANLARVVEENVIRSLSEIDKTLLYLRQNSASNPANADWPRLIRQAFTASEITFQLAVIDAKGRLVATDRGPQPQAPIDLSDRDHFKVHMHAPIDTLYVSRPVLGRVTKRWSVQLTRRLENADGSFAGVIVASLDPAHFSEFYRSVDVGAGGSITLVGIDGFIRASGGQQPGQLGGRLSDRGLIDRIRTDGDGTLTFQDKSSGHGRIASFRWVRNFPLVVVVATNEDQPKSSWLRSAPFYLASATAITLLILGAALAGLRRSVRLTEARHLLDAKSTELEVTLENISQGIMMVDPQGRIGFLSIVCRRMLGLPEDFMAGGKTYRELVENLEASGEFKSGLDDQLLDYIRDPDQHPLIASYERVRPDGSVLEVRTKPLDGGGFVRTISDITGRKTAESKILHLARNDALTGLANRAVFRQKLDEAAQRLATDDVRPFAVHMIDLDRFKPVNDTHGHLVGDKLLKEVAGRLRELVRDGDIVARLGGDEFAVIQAGARTSKQGSALAARICRVLGQSYNIDGNTLVIGATVGIAFAPADSRTAQDLLHAADLALYAAKSRCRGTYAHYQEDMHAGERARRELEVDLRAAIAGRQFELHYQPIVSLASGEITAYEALLRWRHPQRGHVPPLDFIPLAEESGLIGPIGAWVMETACREFGRRQGAARIAINLSPVQFRDPGLVNMIANALAGSGLPASRLEIEITETALLQDDQLTQQHLYALRELGVHVTMDDFGTGYSSLAYLLTYPIQTIKIDRSFVSGIGATLSRNVIVRTIATMAASLGLTTIAEGVETAEQLEVLREMGCTEAQGYYFSKPRPAEEVLPPVLDIAPAGQAAALLATG